MATFPNIQPAYTLSKASNPKVRTVKFGDGYEQRIVFGMPGHNNPKEYSLTFKVKDADAETIEAFLDARAADAASFDFTPPGTNNSAKFVCATWNRNFVSNNWNEITATFRQVFEP